MSIHVIVLCTNLGNLILKVMAPDTLKRRLCLRLPKRITTNNYFP